MPVSSSEVRDRLAAGGPVDGVVPEEVIRCIRRRGLYAVPEMSAMPAGWTELSDSPEWACRPLGRNAGSDRRAELKLARRSRQRWAVAAGSILAGAFGLTVGILDVLH